VCQKLSWSWAHSANLDPPRSLSLSKSNKLEYFAIILCVVQNLHKYEGQIMILTKAIPSLSITSERS
jgi:hypothetical protein